MQGDYGPNGSAEFLGVNYSKPGDTFGGPMFGSKASDGTAIDPAKATFQVRYRIWLASGGDDGIKTFVTQDPTHLPAGIAAILPELEGVPALLEGVKVYSPPADAPKA